MRLDALHLGSPSVTGGRASLVPPVARRGGVRDAGAAPQPAANGEESLRLLSRSGHTGARSALRCGPCRAAAGPLRMDGLGAAIRSRLHTQENQEELWDAVRTLGDLGGAAASTRKRSPQLPLGEAVHGLNWLIWLWPYLNHKPIPTPGQTEEELRRAHSLDGVNCSIPDTVVSEQQRRSCPCACRLLTRAPVAADLHQQQHQQLLLQLRRGQCGQAEGPAVELYTREGAGPLHEGAQQGGHARLRYHRLLHQPAGRQPERPQGAGHRDLPRRAGARGLPHGQR